MKPALSASILVAAICVTPAVASAQSEVYSAVDGRVQVYWQAEGCAGIKTVCAGGWVDHICGNKVLQDGESGRYEFKVLTSDRKVIFYHCPTNYESSDGTGNKGNKKRCAATYDGDKVVFKCGYSAEEYAKIKAGGSLGAVQR